MENRRAFAAGLARLMAEVNLVVGMRRSRPLGGCRCCEPVGAASSAQPQPLLALAQRRLGADGLGWALDAHQGQAFGGSQFGVCRRCREQGSARNALNRMRGARSSPGWRSRRARQSPPTPRTRPPARPSVSTRRASSMATAAGLQSGFAPVGCGTAPCGAPRRAVRLALGMDVQRFGGRHPCTWILADGRGVPGPTAPPIKSAARPP